ncbi:winged helix-turn-helix domain-containing protein [Defluviimonas sp. SAOS-178_SWC]|uniref:winged helix-turn-helix domain-containing protein n=1 Tax=Defluviimonas sp. SAOS-178_SWC TaxID=3121287 RepID=UPI0032220A04
MEKTNNTAMILGTCAFEPSSLTLRDASGAVLPLRSQSLRVLSELARTPGQLVSRDRLIEAVWPGIAVTDDSLVQCIKDVRRALADRERTIVKTAIGQGYILNARVPDVPTDAPPTILVERFSATTALAQEVGEVIFEELLVRLAPRRGIVVETDPDRRCDAKYMVSGHVSERSGGVRVFYRITRLGGGGDLHAAAVLSDAAGMWDLPVKVADSIAAQLRVQMGMRDGSDYATREDVDLSVQELLAKAAWHMMRYRRRNWRTARAALERAAKLAPDNPIALSMLASMETQMIPLIPFSEIAADPDRAMALCERAVELDQSNDWVLRTRGNVRLWLLGDHEGARLDCRRALAINPAFHLAHLTIATSDILSGAFEVGATRLEEMMHRVPFDSQNPLYFSLIAIARLLDGQAGRAIEAAREGHEQNPFGAWNALVYATAVADDVAITGSATFRKLLDRIDLAPSHFLEFPFTDLERAAELTSRAEAAGVGRSLSPPRLYSDNGR